MYLYDQTHGKKIIGVRVLNLTFINVKLNLWKQNINHKRIYIQ